MPEPHKRIIVDAVDFAEVFAFPRILGAVTASMQPPRLLIGLLMVTAIITFGRVWDRAVPATFAPAGLLATPWTDDDARMARAALEALALDPRLVAPGVTLDPPADSEPITIRGWIVQARAEAGGAVHDDVYLEALRRVEALRPRGPYEATAAQVRMSMQGIVQGVLALRADEVLRALGDLFLRAPVALWRQHAWFTIVGGLVLLLVLALGGGAIARMAACQAAGQERLTIDRAVDYAVATWRHLLTALIVPLLYVLGAAVVMVALGLLLSVPWLDVLGAALYGISLLLGLLIALLTVGFAAAGWMLIPAVACERCDGGDAAQRAYAYLIGRPLHLLGYGITALFGLALGFTVISVVAMLTLNITAGLSGFIVDHAALEAAGTRSLFDLGGRDLVLAPTTAHAGLAAWLLSLWETLVVSLVSAYVLVYLFSASTRVYLLMRRACDGQDIQEIWRAGLVPGTLTPLSEPTPGAGSAPTHRKSRAVMTRLARWMSGRRDSDAG